jgi:signal transduction histidine kinase
LDECGLDEALRWYLQGLKERSGLEISQSIPEDFGRLSREMELAIFRLVQECLNNVHRHSGSNAAAIRMVRADHSVILEVEDAGTGIAPEKLLEIQSQGAGVGIRGMRERILQFGGEMKIQSSGRGTKISITLPYARIPSFKTQASVHRASAVV